MDLQKTQTHKNKDNGSGDNNKILEAGEEWENGNWFSTFLRVKPKAQWEELRSNLHDSVPKKWGNDDIMTLWERG